MLRLPHVLISFGEYGKSGLKNILEKTHHSGFIEKSICDSWEGLTNLNTSKSLGSVFDFERF